LIPFGATASRSSIASPFWSVHQPESVDLARLPLRVPHFFQLLSSLLPKKGEMSMTVNRRDFLIRGSSAVAAVGAGTLLPGLPTSAGASEKQGHSPDGENELPTGDEALPLVARIRDVRTGEIDLFFGEHEVSYRDPKLAARLFKAAQ
jgi:Ubiquitinol-cytochrome C reductase Fe-S subunit TAT signal